MAIQNAIAVVESEEVVMSLARCLSLIVKGVSHDSRYLVGSSSLWWIGMTLLQSERQTYRKPALELCEAVLEQAIARFDSRDPRASTMLFEKRSANQVHLDAATGVNWDTKTRWGFSTASLLYPGLKDGSTKEKTIELIDGLLRFTLLENPTAVALSGASLPLYMVLYVSASSEARRQQLWRDRLAACDSQQRSTPSLVSMLDIP